MPLINKQETEEKLEQRKQNILEQRSKRNEELRSLGPVDFDITRYHQAHTRSIVFAGHTHNVSVFDMKQIFMFLAKIFISLFSQS
jgi:predicted phosphodiesterase